MTFRSRELLDLAYLLDCQAQIPGICVGGMGEPMHSNQGEHGIGTATKAADCYFGSGCRACHQAIDHGQPKLVIRGHDAEEFVGVVRRYGVGDPEGGIARLVAAAKQKPEVSGLDVARACGTCMLRAA